MKNLIALFAFTFLLAGTAFAQDSDSHVLTVTTTDFVEIDVDPNMDFVYTYDSDGNSSVTGPGTPSVTETNGDVLITSTDGSELYWNTNLSNMKITVQRSAYTGDFSLDGLRVAPTNIVQNGFTVGSAGVDATPGNGVAVELTESDFITGISQGGGTTDLTYEMDLVIFDHGTTAVEVTYTILSE